MEGAVVDWEPMGAWMLGLACGCMGAAMLARSASFFLLISRLLSTASERNPSMERARLMSLSVSGKGSCWPFGGDASWSW